MKIWTCEKWVPKCLNADQKRQSCQNSEKYLEFFRRDPNDFLSRFVTMKENWLYHYDPETKQQWMEWRHSCLPRPAPPKNSECKFFEIKTAFSSFIIFQRAKLSTRNITHLCWCKWRKIWRKNASAYSPRKSCSCTTMPRLTGHLQPRRNWPDWAPRILITHLILRIWNRRTSTYSLDWKKQLIVRHFSFDAQVIVAADIRLDGQNSVFFLSGLQ